LQMLDFDLILKNNLVLLRPMVYDDFNSFVNITGDRSMWIYFTSDLSVNPELKAWINTAVEDTGSKIRLAFTVIERSSGIVVGSTSFGNISNRDKRLEIGWTWLGREYQGKGINDSMKFLMLKYAFETLEFERVEMKTDVLNIPARKALLRIGATEEGVLRSHTLMTHGRRRDTIFYSILRSEWCEIKGKLGITNYERYS
jgi:RimJ/RimL family protein N-acetyltransferase